MKRHFHRHHLKEGRLPVREGGHDEAAYGENGRAANPGSRLSFLSRPGERFKRCHLQ